MLRKWLRAPCVELKNLNLIEAIKSDKGSTIVCDVLCRVNEAYFAKVMLSIEYSKMSAGVEFNINL